MPAQTEDRTVAVAGDFQLAFRFARVVGRGEMLAPVLDPFHRPAGEARGEWDQKIFGVELAARAEAAADVVFHHANRGLGQAHLLGERAAVIEGNFGGSVHREPPLRGIPFREQTARLHRHGAMALHLESFAPDIGGRLERCLRVPAQAGERQRAIAGSALEQQRCPLPFFPCLRERVGVRAGTIHHRRQGLDVERDRIERVLGGRRAFCQHERDRLADIAHFLVRDHGLLVRLELGRGFLAQRNRRYRRADFRRRDHGMHAGPRPRRGGVDRADAPMGDGTAQDRRVQQVLVGEVVDVLAAAAQEAKILEPLHRAADEDIAAALLVHVRRRSWRLR